MDGSLYVGRYVYEHRSLSTHLWLVATWPTYVWDVRVYTAYGQGEISRLPFFRVSTAKKLLSLAYTEARDMFRQGLRQGLFPGLLAGLATYQADWMVKEIVGSILMDQQDVATAMDRRQRVLSAIKRRIDVLKVVDPERAALSSLYSSIKPWTPLQITWRYIFANLVSAGVAATVTYPLRVVTYKLVCGQLAGPNEAWNMITDREQNSTALWAGYPYYLCASLLGSAIQLALSGSIAQVYDELDGAVSDDGQFDGVEKPKVHQGAPYFFVCSLIDALGNVFTAPLTTISIHQRLGLRFTPAFTMSSIVQMFTLGVSTKPAFEQ